MKIGFYAGTFNPFHIGHLNIYDKAIRIFDKVIIGAGTNPNKPGIYSGLHVPAGVRTLSYQDLLTTEMIKQLRDEGDVTLIRGIRNGYDYDYEMNQIAVMKDLLPDLEVILIPCDREFAHISSTVIRTLWKFDQKAARRYLACPDADIRF